jgi:phenylacetate-coenzyme A ligase PaaK-like adenylate-forming protein
MMNLDRYYYWAAHNMIVFDAHSILGSPILVWMPILPSIAGLPAVLRSIKMGKTPIRWFSPVEARTIKPSLTKRLATYYIVYAGRLFGAAFPKPEYVNFEQADKVADYMAEVLKKGQGCVLWTAPSSAVRVCQVSRQRQLDLSGTTFIVAGEPLTEAKMREIRAIGANAVNQYAIAEVGTVGFGCAGQTAAPDDIHLLKDSHAVIQHQRETPFGGASVDAFLFTSVLHKAPKILLNVESGDYGVIETRQCGCKLEEFGLTEHIYNIRSFEKLTGEGMTFVGTDILRIIEEVLPAKFGGVSTDYQMVEEEDEQGHTRLSIIVNPEVGEIDEGELVQTVLSELSKGKDTQRMMTEIWSQAEMLRVKRQRPLITAAGKLLPLHIQKLKNNK